MHDDGHVNEFYNERAAIFEFCANIPRDEAEVMSYFETKRALKQVTNEIKATYSAAQKSRLHKRDRC